jgi:hypothetical protein
VAAPAGWDATIYRRAAEAGAVTYPVLHAATIPLPAASADYGAGIVELLGADDVFVAVVEFDPTAAGRGLFSASAPPGLTPDLYRPRQLQRLIAGQAGVQRFFTSAGRAFCLYSVIGSWANRVALSYRANQVIGSLEIAASS